MDEINGPSGPRGPRGMEGWSSDEDVVGKQVTVFSKFFEGERKIETQTQEFFYIDRTNREIGVRTSTGGRVFVNLDDVLSFLNKEAR
jgi:hypothetical protein